MSDLVEFLRARLDEDEARARGEGPHIVFHDPAGRPLPPPPMPGSYPAGRVLREVEAKRRILAEHRPMIPGWCHTCDVPADVKGNEHGCLTVRLLALPYADHPNYREAWRP